MSSFDKSLIIFCALNILSFAGGMLLPNESELGLWCTVWWFVTLPVCFGIGAYFAWKRKRDLDANNSQED